MSRITIRVRVPRFFKEFGDFLRFLNRYVHVRGYIFFSRFEFIKGLLVDLLYKKRGRYSRPFLHFGTLGLIFLVITLGRWS